MVPIHARGSIAGKGPCGGHLGEEKLSFEKELRTDCFD